MKILVACEESGVVRRAFVDRGHDAWSCDVLPSRGDHSLRGRGGHLRADVLTVLDDGWDMMIAFPPCTHLAAAGARWFGEKRQDGRQQRAIAFFMALARAPICRIAIENPVGVMSTAWRKPDQIIQPWQHGHGETKATCLWLKGLELLEPTDVVNGRVARCHRMAPSPTRSRDRSRTYPGVAAAMAERWG